MATRHGTGAPPKGTTKKLTTYGKTPKRRLQYAKPGKPSADAQEKGIAPNNPSNTTSSSSSPEPLSYQASDSARKPPSEKKRKANEVDPFAGQYIQSSEESSPSSPSKRQSRGHSPTRNRAGVREGKKNSQAARSTSFDTMDIDGGRMPSSPPPTPTYSRELSMNGTNELHEPATISPNTINTFGNMGIKNAKKSKPRSQVQGPSLHLPARPKPFQNQQQQHPRNQPSTSAKLRGSVAKATYSTAKATKPTRKRVVDALKQQTEVREEIAVTEKSDSQVSWSDTITSSHTSETSTLDSQASPSTPNPRRVQSTKARTYARSTSSLKHTYGQNITLREEDDPYASLGIADDVPAFSKVSQGRRLELGHYVSKSKSSLGDDDLDMGASPKTKIHNIHELRKAGANSRAADDMLELGDQIGSPNMKPNSSRRAAFVQIADRIRERDFRQQIRDYGVEAKIFKGAATELDPVSGYLILAILVHLVSTSTAPHLVQIIHTEEIGTLFTRLMKLDQDIKKLAQDRKTNLSKRHQLSLGGIGNTLLELPLWKSKPAYLSPRTLTLICLSRLIAPDVDLGQDMAIFPPSVTDELFAVLSSARDEEFWDTTYSVESIDVNAAAAILERHALKAMDAGSDIHTWMTCYVPTAAEVFGTILQKPAARNSQLEHSLLKFVIDITNFQPNVVDIFASKDVLTALSTSVCNSFVEASTAVSEDDPRTHDMIARLILQLAALGTFAEHSTPARQKFFECAGGSPLNELFRIFVQNIRAADDADSETKGLLNVATAYLSVLLGYLSLYSPVRQSFKSNHGPKCMEQLLQSIAKFIEVHTTANQHKGFTDDLRNLIHKLRIDSACD